MVTLILLLIGSDLLSIGPRAMNRRPIIGEVAGKKITLQAFQERWEGLQQGFFLQYERMPGELEKTILQEQVWRQVVTDLVYERLHQMLGISVTSDELVDMVQGEHVHPGLKTIFTDSETKKFDKKKLLAYLAQLAQLPVAQQKQWHELEEKLAEDRCNTKYNQLVLQSAFITNASARSRYQLFNTKLDVKYLYIPYTSVQSGLPEVSETLLKQYLKEHKAQYQVEESRGVAYVTFPMLPTSADRLAFEQELEVLSADFKEAKDSKAFARAQTEGPSALAYETFSEQNLPEALSQQSLKPGMVIGPVERDRKYKLYKVVAIHKDQEKPYEVAIIHKKLVPGDDTKDKALRQAENFGSLASNQKKFEAQALQDGLEVHYAQVSKDDFHIGKFLYAREVARWVYGEAKIGKVSPTFELEGAYIVAVMTDKQQAGTANLEDVRDEITNKIKNQQKAQHIIEKLGAISGNTLEDMAMQYGDTAVVLSKEELEFKESKLPGVGKAIQAIGLAFGLEIGERSKP
ncbi:MAG: SurA N-terminal domain-containing protein, partial [Bacteroidota bacterium]